MEMDRVPAGEVHDLRLEEPKANAEFKLSVEAAGRKEVKKSARLKAGGGDVEAEEGAIDPEDERRAVSAFQVSRGDNTTGKPQIAIQRFEIGAYHHRACFAQSPFFQRRVHVG